MGYQRRVHGECLCRDRTKMKTFLASLLLSVASAAPTPDVSSHVTSHGHGAVVSHGSHLTHGLVAATPFTHTVQAVHTPVQAVRTFSTPVVAGTPFTHAVHAVHTPVQAFRTVPASPVTHTVHAVHTPVQAVRTVATPVVAAPVAPVVVKAAPATVTDEKEVPEPYTYSYGVADAETNSNFNKAETADANGVVGGSYSISLPDGRIQTVTYTADEVNGFVADVSYSGEAVYPPAPAGGYPGEENAFGI